MENMQKSTLLPSMTNHQAQEIYKLFTQLARKLESQSLYEARYLVLVGLTSFEDALFLRREINKT